MLYFHINKYFYIDWNLIFVMNSNALTTLTSLPAPCGQQAWKSYQNDGRCQYHENADAQANTDRLHSIEEYCQPWMA